jgi:hypothetical protein
MKGSLKRRAVVVAVAGLTGVLLCSCSTKSHVSAGLRNDVLVFVNCDDYQARNITVFATGAEQEWSSASETWSASGNDDLGSGVLVQYGVPPQGFTSSIGPQSFDPKSSQFSVTFSNPDTASKFPSSTGDFDGRKLVRGKWLNWDGNIHDRPCSG